MVDQLVMVNHYPQPDSKQPIARMEYSPGGQVATAMVTCSRLGLRASYVGRFGDDVHGKWGLESLSEEGVDTNACLIAEATPNEQDVRTAETEQQLKAPVRSRIVVPMQFVPNISEHSLKPHQR